MSLYVWGYPARFAVTLAAAVGDGDVLADATVAAALEDDWHVVRDSGLLDMAGKNYGRLVRPAAARPPGSSIPTWSPEATADGESSSCTGAGASGCRGRHPPTAHPPGYVTLSSAGRQCIEKDLVQLIQRCSAVHAPRPVVQHLAGRLDGGFVY